MVKITKSPLPNKQKARTVLKGKELRPCFCTIFPKIEKPGRCILRLRPVSKDARKRHTFFPEHTLKKAFFFFFFFLRHHRFNLCISNEQKGSISFTVKPRIMIRITFSVKPLQDFGHIYPFTSRNKC